MTLKLSEPGRQKLGINSGSRRSVQSSILTCTEFRVKMKRIFDGCGFSVGRGLTQFRDVPSRPDLPWKIFSLHWPGQTVYTLTRSDCLTLTPCQVVLHWPGQTVYTLTRSDCLPLARSDCLILTPCQAVLHWSGQTVYTLTRSDCLPLSRSDWLTLTMWDCYTDQVRLFYADQAVGLSYTDQVRLL